MQNIPQPGAQFFYVSHVNKGASLYNLNTVARIRVEGFTRGKQIVTAVLFDGTEIDILAMDEIERITELVPQLKLVYLG